MGGLAGIGVEAKFKIEYADGVFRLTAHASLCIGVGAEGALTFEVGAKQMALFFRCLFYNIAYWQFKNLNIIVGDAFEALKGMQFLAAQSGSEIESYYGWRIAQIGDRIDEINKALASRDERLKLAQRILSNQDSLRYTLPEVRGMLIHQLTRENDGNFNSRRGVLALVKSASCTQESANICQHVGKNGEKGNLDENLSRLASFFRADGYANAAVLTQALLNPDGFGDDNDQIALSGDFVGWYQAFQKHLIDEVPHGQTMLASTSAGYRIFREMRDHALFASNGWGAYYTDEA
ncbi:hypothetical protein AWV80_03910 [Cupriavidus sp. UYMU48A]|nr:hypothetical protein AWV80_03910 [Cupriavidus sp. UYMU48A]